MSSRNARRLLSLLALTMTLAACGESSSSSSSPPPPSASASGQSTASGTAPAASSTAAAPSSTPATLAFAQSSYTVAQRAGTVRVEVMRAAGMDGAVSVTYATLGGAGGRSAVAGVDFTATGGTLTWAPRDAAPKTVAVSLSDARGLSDSKIFQLLLSAPSSGATLGTPSSTVVTIQGEGAPPSAPPPASAGTIAMLFGAYRAAQSAGSVTVTVARGKGSAGAVGVRYATADGTAKAGTDYTSARGTLNWAAGDASPKSLTVPLSDKVPFQGSRAFTVALSGVSGGATLDAAATAVVTITGSAVPATPGSIALSAPRYGIAQSGGTLVVTAVRTSGAAGAVSVHYASADGTAKAGTDYTAASGTLSWANGDSSAKSFKIAVSNATPFAGTRAFTIALSSVAGGATLAAPSTAAVTVTGTGTVSSAECTKSAAAWTTTGIFDSKDYGNYLVNNNDWSNTPGQHLWVNDKDCWGVTTTFTTDNGGIRSYPSVTRGWTQNDTMMLQLSTPGTNDWTTKSGMGIAVTALTKAKIHWAFTAPTTGGTRWLGLMDIYFHQSATPSSSTWPPFVDLMIDQSIADQVVNSSTYYALVASMSHATTVTLGGNTYLLYIDNSGEASYHQPAGHDIHLFQLPTASTSSNANPNWGVADAVTDLAAIVKYFMQSNPVDDGGHPLQNASGAVIRSPLIVPGLFLDAINAGWEIDTGTTFTNRAFCVAMQNEPDCP